MSENKQKKGFFGNWIVRNLLRAVIIVVALVIGAVIFLNVVTQHNKEIGYLLCRSIAFHLDVAIF